MPTAYTNTDRAKAKAIATENAKDVQGILKSLQDEGYDIERTQRLIEKETHYQTAISPRSPNRGSKNVVDAAKLHLINLKK